MNPMKLVFLFYSCNIGIQENQSRTEEPLEIKYICQNPTPNIK